MTYWDETRPPEDGTGDETVEPAAGTAGRAAGAPGPDGEAVPREDALRTEATPNDAGDAPARMMYRLRLKPGRERSLLLRHPWVFSGAIAEVEELPGAQPGDLGDVVDSRGTFLARGTVQPESQIVLRVLAFEPRPIDLAFFEERIGAAAEARRTLVDPAATTAWREVNSEGDLLPGLVVDRYGTALVTQTLTSGMLRLRPLWVEALRRALPCTAILERGERARRERIEEQGRPGSPLWGEAPAGPIEILEHGLRFVVDLEGGQKTGFYLDQRENRAQVRAHARDAEVLNLFGYTGAFSVHAGAGGARRVVQVETSAPARELTRLHWERNGLPADALELSAEDAFRFLRHDARHHDRLILDPPPFAKDRGSLERATRAYKDLHLWGFCRVRPGALVWTFSCSQQMTADLFQKVVFGAARDVDADVQILGRLGAAPDHPVHLDHPQGEYLKGLWLRVRRPGTPPAPGRSGG